MLALTFENLRHIYRSKMFFIILFFGIGVHYLGLKLLNGMSVQFQGSTTLLGKREALFFSVFLLFFTEIFLTIAYGMWMAPYNHQGRRIELTFVLPISKWCFPLSYMVSFFILQVINLLLMFLCLFYFFRFDFEMNWLGLSYALAFQFLALQAVMLGLAVCALSFGQLMTLFLFSGFYFLMQLSSAVKRFGLFDSHSPLLWVLDKLPPVGELVFDLRQALKGVFEYQHLILWAVWLVIFATLFKLKLSTPNRLKPAEN